jgi:membrane-associated protease RseP (regulator of RpoE activity)
VTASAQGFGDATEPQLARAQAGGEAFVKLTLASAVSARGHVLDAATRSPIAGAEVDVFRRGFGPRMLTVMTDAGGRFALGAVPRSAFVWIRKGGYGTAAVPVEALLGDGEVALQSGSEGAVPGLQPYEGVGMQLDLSAGMHVSHVFEQGPAEAAGVLAGDRIQSVDGQSIDGLAPDEVVRRIMGASGSQVTLTLERDGTTVTVPIRRGLIQF